MLKILGKLRRAILRGAEPAQRLAAPAVQTRQCKRNLLFRVAFDTFSRTFPGEGRAQRRAMARAWAKNRWRQRVAA